VLQECVLQECVAVVCSAVACFSSEYCMSVLQQYARTLRSTCTPVEEQLEEPACTHV